MTADRLDAAIAAAEAPPTVPLREIEVALGPDRFALLGVPADLNVVEVLGLVAFLTAGGLGRAMAAANTEPERPQLAIARSLPPRDS